MNTFQHTPWFVPLMAELMFRDGGRDAPYVDCFGLVRLVYARHCGIDLPEWPDLVLQAISEAGQSLLQSRFTAGFHGVQTGFEQAFDVAVIRRPMVVNNRAAKGWWHMGVVSGPGFILHMDMHKGVVNEPFRDTVVARGSATLKPHDVLLFRHEAHAGAAMLAEAVA